MKVLDNRCLVRTPATQTMGRGGREDALSKKPEPERSCAWTKAILFCRPDSDDPIYHDQENDEGIDQYQFVGS